MTCCIDRIVVLALITSLALNEILTFDTKVSCMVVLLGLIAIILGVKCRDFTLLFSLVKSYIQVQSKHKI